MINKNPLLVLFLFLLPASVFAQQISKVNVLPNDVYTLSSMRSAGGKLFYADFTRLWVTDGLPGSTAQLLTTATGGLDQLTAFNNKLYFVAKDGQHGSELWCSDGTVAGTHLQKDLFPGTTSFFSTPGSVYGSDTLEYYNGKLTFIRTDTAGHAIIYTYDGTDTGQVYQRDLFPHISAIFTAKFTRYGKIYIAGSDNFGNTGLFVMNNIQDSAKLLLTNNDNFGFMELNDKVFFTGQTAGIYHLCVSDGTIAGTQDLNYDMGFTSSSSYPEYTDFTTLNNELYFSHEYHPVGTSANINKLVKTDGTVLGTSVIKQGFSYNSSFYTSMLNRKKQGLSSFNNKVYFSILDSSNSGIWQTDGTNAGTVCLLKTSMQPANLTIYSHALYFQYLDSPAFVIGKTDGTLAGTTKIADTLSRYPAGAGFALSRSYRNPPMVLFNGDLYYTSNRDTSAGKSLYRLHYFPAAIQTASTEKNLKLYPNPANDKIAVDAKGFKSLELTSVDGKMLLQSDLNLADVSALPNGIYIVTVFTTSGILKDKLLIAR